MQNNGSNLLTKSLLGICHITNMISIYLIHIGPK